MKMKYRNDASCYLLAKNKIKWIYVKWIFVVILLEVNTIVAGKATHIHSKGSNISYRRGKRQVSFGGGGKFDNNEKDFQEFPDYHDQDNSFDFHEDPNIKSQNSFKYPSTESTNVNIQDFLQENGETPGNRFFFGGSSEGESCTTPNGESGTCSFIHSDKCQDVKRNLFNPSRREQVIQYILRAIQSPCGFAFFDFTLCCSDDSSPPNTSDGPSTVEPTTEKPTTQEPTPTDQCGVSGQGTRIVNGRECGVNQWPWAVVLGKSSSGSSGFRVVCGGTLITRRHVLSAAHCFIGGNRPSVARFGEHDITNEFESSSVDRQIESYKIHEEYDNRALVNDIAIAIVSGGDLPFSRSIRPACLPYDYVGRDYETFRDDPSIVGWGATRNNGGASDICRQATVPIVSIPECQQDYRGVSRVNINEDMVCAGQGRRDSCAGDSGGPMLSNFANGRWSVIGIVSFGVDCASERHPGVYTRVDRYLDWIEKEIGDRSGQRNENRRRPNGNRRRPNGNHRRPNNRKRNKNRRNQNRNPQVVNNQDYNDNDGVIFGK